MTEPARTPFAAGDYLTRYPPGQTYALRIDAPFEKQGWKTRTFSPGGHVIFPGSTIEFEEILYELVFQEHVPGPPVTVRYYLNPWDDRFPIRFQFHYNKEECLNAAKHHRDTVRSNRQNLMLGFFAPVVGMLPAEDQIKIANRFGMQATRMTFSSGLLLLPFAGYAVVFLALNLIYGAPLPGPGWMHWLYPFAFYFFAESLLRMFTSAKLDEPTGSLFVAVPVLLWRSIQRIWDPKAKQKAFENLQPQDSRGRDLLRNATDEILPAQDEQHIEIISLLPKPHWTPKVAIALNGVWYGLVKSEKAGKQNSIIYKFLLKRAPEGTWFSSVIDYDPEEVKMLFREKRRKELKTWVDTFAFLWGLLNRQEQTRLEELYEFDVLKFTRITLFSIVVLATANLVVSLINLTAGVASSLDIWLLLLSGFFLLESYSRWKEWRSGQPSGSVLAFFVRPFARKLLAGP